MFIWLGYFEEQLLHSVQNLDLQSDYYFQEDNDPKDIANNIRHWIIYNTPHTWNLTLSHRTLTPSNIYGMDWKEE